MTAAYPTVTRNPAGSYQLFRIGDAVIRPSSTRCGCACPYEPMFTQGRSGDPAYGPGPYSPTEYQVEAFCRWYIGRLLASLP